MKDSAVRDQENREALWLICKVFDCIIDCQYTVSKRLYPSDDCSEYQSETDNGEFIYELFGKTSYGSFEPLSVETADTDICTSICSGQIESEVIDKMLKLLSGAILKFNNAYSDDYAEIPKFTTLSELKLKLTIQGLI